MVSLIDIQQFFRGNIALNEPMEKYTTMRVGGPADYYLEPVDKHDLAELVKYFQNHSFPFMALGRGSNIVFSDEGYRGAVMNLESPLSSLRLEGEIVIAEAGAPLTRFVDFCIQNGFSGVEMLAGIPGTVGGAVIMNAGAYGGEISNYLVDVEVIRNGQLQCVKKEEGQFVYRNSGFVHDIVLCATFKLPQGKKEALLERRRELILKRNANHPLNYPNSGSMFKNPPGNPAAKLIESVGLKGKRVGNAQISEKHANFIVNLGGAKAADIITLLELARRSVYQHSGILLEIEVKLIGFSEEVRKRIA
ncbi:MAG: UDP-N-acetylmuramate dehydrogenase [bacterium]